MSESTHVGSGRRGQARLAHKQLRLHAPAAGQLLDCRVHAAHEVVPAIAFGALNEVFELALILGLPRERRKVDRTQLGRLIEQLAEQLRACHLARREELVEARHAQRHVGVAVADRRRAAVRGARRLQLVAAATPQLRERVRQVGVGIDRVTDERRVTAAVVVHRRHLCHVRLLGRPRRADGVERVRERSRLATAPVERDVHPLRRWVVVDDRLLAVVRLLLRGRRCRSARRRLCKLAPRCGALAARCLRESRALCDHLLEPLLPCVFLALLGLLALAARGRLRSGSVFFAAARALPRR
eukprot:817333-Prymnesium_polylepis.1